MIESTLTVLQAIQAALVEEMERDEDVVVLGEDVATAGGVFRATEGLLGRFGEERVIDTPLNESGIVGVAIGMALYGLKPVAEIQFADFIYPAFDQIVSELAKMRYRSGGEFTCPIVIRTPSGGGIRGGDVPLAVARGLLRAHRRPARVRAVDPADAKGLLKAAIRGHDPVIFFEPKRIYRTVKADVSDDPDLVVTARRGAAACARAPTCRSISYGASVHTCLEAAASGGRAGNRGGGPRPADARARSTSRRSSTRRAAPAGSSS